jgi:hypothetical protein
MTQDEIIEMAREAGFEDFVRWSERYPHEVQRWIERMKAFAKLATAKEREACAKLIEEMPCDCCWPENSISLAEDFADAIRARGEQA